MRDYKKGLTPNPDILCNSKIKFDVFLQYTRNLGFDLLATGHYARLSETADGMQLLQPIDTWKDQTYFLACVPGKALRNVLFPLGRLTKTMVRNIAVKVGLQWVARQRESMGICFIGPRPLQDFLELYLEKRPGFIEAIDGSVVGEHNGLFYYTIGQRVRLPGLPDRLYVIEKDEQRNTVIVGAGWNHPALYSTQFHTKGGVNWISENPWLQLTEHGALQCKVRVRHGQPLVDCIVQLEGSVDERQGCSLPVRVEAWKPVRAVTPGQVAAFYLGEECLGGAEIASRLISIHED